MTDIAIGEAPRGHEDNAKCRQILDGAREVFLAQGYDAASMNDIARVAGVSKGTLYVYFASKEDLFEALIRQEKREQGEQLFHLDPNDRDVRAVLTRLGHGLLGMGTQPTSIARVRMVIGITERQPQIGRAFFESGPLIGGAKLTAYFDAQVAAGRLDIGDTNLAALQFLSLCHGDLMRRLLFGVITEVTAEQIQVAVRQAVDMFLAAYGSKRGQPN